MKRQSALAFFWKRSGTLVTILAILVALVAVFIWPDPSKRSTLLSILMIVVQMLILLAMNSLLFIGPMMLMARPKVDVFTPDDEAVDLHWDDYRGNPEILKSAKRIVNVLNGVTNVTKLGGDPPHGMLMIGPPGCGKSWLARIISAESKCAFMYVDSGSFRKAFWGLDTISVHLMASRARKLSRKYGKPTIVFMDEIDTIGMARAGVTGSASPMGGGGGQVLQTLLTVIDSNPTNDGWLDGMIRGRGLKRGPAKPAPVFWIGATNIDTDLLDPALLRAGRLDRQIQVDKPDGTGRMDVLSYYLAKVQHETMDLDAMSADSMGYTPADIKFCINEAIILASSHDRDKMNYEDWCEAYETHELGLKTPITNLSAEEKRRIAYHEAGHAVAWYHRRPDQRISRATIVRRGGALGLVQAKDREERYTLTADEALANIDIAVASRAAELEFLKIRMSGFSGDLTAASQEAYWYLNDIAFGSRVVSEGSLGIPTSTKHADEISKLLKKRIVAMRTLLRTNEKQVHAMAGALIEKGDLSSAEVKALLEAS